METDFAYRKSELETETYEQWNVMRRNFDVLKQNIDLR